MRPNDPVKHICQSPPKFFPSQYMITIKYECMTNFNRAYITHFLLKKAYKNGVKGVTYRVLDR